ncbi:MAG: hypothetical protein ACLVK3_02760 [Levyella massiliensis]
MLRRLETKPCPQATALFSFLHHSLITKSVCSGYFANIAAKVTIAGYRSIDESWWKLGSLEEVLLSAMAEHFTREVE